MSLLNSGEVAGHYVPEQDIWLAIHVANSLIWPAENTVEDSDKILFLIDVFLSLICYVAIFKGVAF